VELYGILRRASLEAHGRQQAVAEPGGDRVAQEQQLALEVFRQPIALTANGTVVAELGDVAWSAATASAIFMSRVVAKAWTIARVGSGWRPYSSCILFAMSSSFFRADEQTSVAVFSRSVTCFDGTNGRADNREGACLEGRPTRAVLQRGAQASPPLNGGGLPWRRSLRDRYGPCSLASNE